MEGQEYEVVQLVEVQEGIVACTPRAEAWTDLEAPLAAGLVELRPKVSALDPEVAASFAAEVAAAAEQ